MMDDDITEAVLGSLDVTARGFDRIGHRLVRIGCVDITDFLTALRSRGYEVKPIEEERFQVL